MKRVFSIPPPDGIKHLNAIGLVTCAALAQLTPTQKYFFDFILSILGEDMASNIFMMATLADGGTPPVFTAVKAANIPCCDLFKFNNSSLYARPNDTIGEMFWKIVLKCFENFFAHLTTVESQSLHLTREVLRRKVNLKPGEYVMNCLKCNFTCHYPCTISNDELKWRCDAMNWIEAGENSVCGMCPGNCHWTYHCSVPYRFDSYETEEERTLDVLSC